jgi:NAD(P)-dependent dehydrogenase (short-subunit alcohol dehydrogenase family)
VTELGGLDVMFANAGVGSGGPFLDQDDATYDRIMDVNMRGVYLCGQAAARAMVAQGRGGSIINTASTYAEVTAPQSSVYSASKGGVRMLTKGMAVELGPHGIRVNCIGPGWIRTGMNPLDDEARVARILDGVPLGRIGTPRDVAGAALFLASDDAAYVTGIIIFVDGGWILQ